MVSSQGLWQLMISTYSAFKFPSWLEPTQLKSQNKAYREGNIVHTCKDATYSSATRRSKVMSAQILGWEQHFHWIPSCNQVTREGCRQPHRRVFADVHWSKAMETGWVRWIVVTMVSPHRYWLPSNTENNHNTNLLYSYSHNDVICW